MKNFILPLLFFVLSGSSVASANDLEFRVKQPAEKTDASVRTFAPARISSEEVQLMGCAFGSNAGNPSGLYKFSTTAPEMEFIHDRPQATGGGTLGVDTYYCQWHLNMLGMDIWANMAFNTDTWEFDGATGDLENEAYDLAYDFSTDRIYGCFCDPDENYRNQRLVFGYINAADYADDSFNGMRVHPICDLFVAFSGLAFDGQGNLFALTKEGILMSVDKTTGVYTQVGETGLTAVYNSSAAIDPATGIMYYFLCNDEATTLYAIDITTAEASALYVLPGGEEIQGLAIFVPRAADDAPAVPENLSTTFNEGNLSGTVNFNLPTNTYSGQPGTGEITYRVSYRPYGEETEYTLLTEGTGSYGENIMAPVTLPENGYYTFGVILASASGSEAPLTVTDRYVGYDQPLSPGDVILTGEGNNLSLSWSAPTSTIHNGYLDEANIEYTVIRYPDEQTVASGLRETSFSETLPDPEGRVHYQYSVTASNHGVVSYPTLSNPFGVGGYGFPYVCGFETQAEYDEFTVINKEANPTHYCHWQYQSYRQAAHVGNGTADDDDILVTPALAFVSGHEYEITLEVSNNDNTHQCRFSILAGSEPTREALTSNVVAGPLEFNAKYPAKTTITADYTPAGSDIRHIGIHSLNEARCFDDFYVHSISITDKTIVGLNNKIVGKAQIIATAGKIIVDTPERLPLEVISTDGKRVSHKMVNGRCELNVTSGIYLVRLGSDVTKVAVR